jgi:CRISPR-associated protein Cas2
MSSNKHWYLVSYDIRDPKRWRLVYTKLQGTGERIQYSLFRCRLNSTEKEALRWELEKFVAEEDDLLFVHLCRSCSTRIQERNKENDWEAAPQRFKIL